MLKVRPENVVVANRLMRNTEAFMRAFLDEATETDLDDAVTISAIACISVCLSRMVDARGCDETIDYLRQITAALETGRPTVVQ